MIRTIFYAAAAATLALSTAPAFAHATLSPAEAPAGATVKVAIAIPHGCDGVPTDTVMVTLPEGFVSAKPQVKAGWTLDITTGDYAQPHDVHGSAVSSGALAVKWSGGSVPDGAFDEFVIRGTVAGIAPGTELPFAVTQMCGTASVAWDQLAAPGEDAHSLANPAPVLKVAAASAAGDDHHMHGAAMPAEVTAGDLTLSGGFTRATLPNAPVGGGFLTITNNGSEDDRLVSATTTAAGVTQIHEMKMEGDVMKMNELPDGLIIPAGETVTLAPGGYHLMFMQLNAPLVEGTTVPVTLSFEKAGTVEVTLSVEGIAARSPAMDHSGHGM